MPGDNLRISASEVALFSDQLAMMTQQGIPIVQAINVAAKSSNEAFATQLQAILRKIESGFTLSAAVSLYPRTFSPTYTTLLRAGEECGTMVSVLEPLARLLRRSGEMRSRFLSSLAYPTMVFGSSLLMVFFLVTYMLPNFLSMFGGKNAEVPWLTKVVMAIGTSKLVVIGIPVALAIAGFEIARAYRIPKRRVVLQRTLHKMPLVGSILRELNLIHVTRTIGILREGGVDIYRSLSCLLKGDLGDPALHDALGRVQKEVLDGSSFADSLATQPEFPQTMVAMISTGEETGTMDIILSRYSQLAEENLENTIDSLVALLEPLTMAFVGIVVGIVLLAAFLPIYQLMLQV